MADSAKQVKPMFRMRNGRAKIRARTHQPLIHLGKRAEPK